MAVSGLNWRFIFRVGGLILILESLFMFISSGVAFYYKGTDTQSLLISGIISLLSGFLILIPTGLRNKIKIIGKRESFISVFIAWFLFALFGSFPFFLSGEIPSFSNAFFESVSGITTTGASVLTDIDSMSQGLLFWRSLIQWLGGLGIVVFSLALLPLLGGEAGQLFDAESSGLVHDKFRPRITAVAKRLWSIYLGLTLLLTILLYLGPMDWFDAICHAFTTISTGGFSTKQASLAYWDSFYIEGISVLFMVIGATNFTLLYFLFKGKFRRFFRDEELRWYLGIIAVVSLLIAVCLYKNGFYPEITQTLRNSVFQVVSIFTTTGFSTGDFTEWGPFYWIVFILLMVVCGCAGSTSGGMKTIRAVVLAKNTVAEFSRLIHPRAIIPVRLNKKALSFGVVQRLLAFAFLYICIIFFSWLILTLSGMPFSEALGASVSGISNVGPGLGSISPSGSYAEIPLFAKWYLSILMIIGRLEIFTVLILFSPDFWKQ